MQIALFAAFLACFASGCRRSETKRTPGATLAPPPVLASAAAQSPIPQNLASTQRRETLLQSLRKRILGHLEAKEDVERVVRQIRPLIDRAVNSADAQPVLQQMALAGNITLEEQKKRFAGWQEADVLLESGGREDVVSSAKAVGAAQWLAGTAQGVGLKVNVKESARLSALIADRAYSLAWGEYLSQPANAAKSAARPPDVDREKANLPALRAELEALRAKRREADERYDPEKAIAAQTRYLLKMNGRYPSPEWIFQAYHGGEGGVARTLKLYGGSPDFESLYFDLTPQTNLPAFLYLYGRSDDHRYYWWKICVAHDILDLFRRDPKAFQTEWESLLPGRSKAVLWRPSAHREAFSSLLAVQEAAKAGTLIPVASGKGLSISTEAGEAFLRPESAGLLRLVLNTYREYGGTAPLLLTGATLPQDLLLKRRAERLAKRPPKTAPRPLPPIKPAFVPQGDVAPADFDFLSTGFAFELKPPANATQRRILDYALSAWSDKDLLWHYKPKDSNGVVVVPSPRFRDALKKFAN